MAYKALTSSDKKETIMLAWLKRTSWVIVGVFAFISSAAVAGQGDTLGIAVSAPDQIESQQSTMDRWRFTASDRISYDDNIYRIPDDFHVTSVVGPGASRGDRLNTASLGANDLWSFGRQSLSFDVHGDDNRYDDDNDLNNVSGTAKLALIWRLSSVLSGQVGADFSRSLLGFAGTTFYTKDLADSTEYFGAARYQLGPHWAVFAGAMQADSTYSALVARGNNSRDNIGNVGLEYALAQGRSIGLDYRYSRTEFTEESIFENPPYKEDRLRLLLGWALTDKTQVNASAGYLKRSYDNSRFALEGFAGDVWRVTGLWQPTEKIHVSIVAWRELQAYVATEADYLVSKGGLVLPSWDISDRFKLSLSFSYEDQNYIPSLGEIVLSPREDKITSEKLSVSFSPRDYLIFTLAGGRERRASNAHQFSYDDDVSELTAVLKF